MEMALPNPLAMFMAASLIGLSFLGSTIWTTYDYFVAWANLPELPLAFDADLVQAADFLNHQSPDARVYISQEVYRPPTLMLLGEHVPTSRYVDRATRFKEVDARTMLTFGAQDPHPIYVFIRDYAPPAEWLDRVAPTIAHLADDEYSTAIRLGALVPPQQPLDILFNPYLKLVGESRYADEPRGVLLYWQVVALPADRQESDTTLALVDARGNSVAQDKMRFGAPPLEWSVGDTMIEWRVLDATDAATQFSIELKRGAETFYSPVLDLR
jgi:hypothetical protein